MAVEAVYHHKCTVKLLPARVDKTDVTKRGRPTAESKAKTFDQFCLWFEQQPGIHSVKALYDKLCTYSHEEVYSIKAFRQKLKDQYNNYLYFPGKGRNSDMVCLESMTDCIIRDYAKKPQTEENLMIAAGKVIRERIRSLKVSTEVYPNKEDLLAEEEGNPWIPSCLSLLMQQVLPSPAKQTKQKEQNKKKTNCIKPMYCSGSEATFSSCSCAYSPRCLC